MSWEIYDANKYLGYFGSHENLVNLLKLNLPATNQFINSGEADAQLQERVVEELSNHPGCEKVADMIRDGEPPIRLSNGTEAWLDDYYLENYWDEE